MLFRSGSADLHTVLRLPDGTFSPYTAGTRTNVLFFSSGKPTSTMWVYDARTREGAARRPLEETDLEEFVTCFGQNPVDVSGRSTSDSASGRWKNFNVQQLRDVEHEIDRLPWRANLEPEPNSDLLKPLRDARKNIQDALREVDELLATFERS